MKKNIFPVLALLLAGFTLAAVNAQADVVRPAPNFTWNSGKSLRDWKGQPVVLIIAPSPESRAFRKQASRIEASYLQFSGRKVIFVAAFTNPDAASQPVRSNVPFVVAKNGAQIAADYGFNGNFAIAVIGTDGNLDLNSAKVIPSSRIMDMIFNNAEMQAAERKL